MPGASEQSALPTPRVIGRTARLVLAALLLYFLLQLARHAREFLAAQPGWRVPGGDWWVAALFCFWALPEVVNSGFSRRWGRWPQGVFAALVAMAAAWDRLAYGILWAPPLALLVYLLLFYVCAHAAVSFAAAAIAATPG
ncbi:MAG TPA: hypothetical protein VGS20_03405 [Candidatus Acidoferrales bacterium]|nr:hypothetical protein [Candidatus Acidoferrales bacterium]